MLLTALDDYERDCLAMLAAASEEDGLAGDSWDALLSRVIEDAACEHLRAELQWVVSTRARIIEFGQR